MMIQDIFKKQRQNKVFVHCPLMILPIILILESHNKVLTTNKIFNTFKKQESVDR